MQINCPPRRLLQCFAHAPAKLVVIAVIEAQQCLMIHNNTPDSMQLSLPLHYLTDGMLHAAWVWAFLMRIPACMGYGFIGCSVTLLCRGFSDTITMSVMGHGVLQRVLTHVQRGFFCIIKGCRALYCGAMF